MINEIKEYLERLGFSGNYSKGVMEYSITKEDVVLNILGTGGDDLMLIGIWKEWSKDGEYEDEDIINRQYIDSFNDFRWLISNNSNIVGLHLVKKKK
jgi:hypothetical protein